MKRGIWGSVWNCFGIIGIGIVLVFVVEFGLMQKFTHVDYVKPFERKFE